MFTPKGKFGWYELMTTDPAAAGKFYTEVVGWTTREMPGPTGNYTIFEAGGTGLAGMMAMPPGATGAPPSWIGYIAVDDIDAYVAKITEAGGTQCHPVTDVPGMLRFSVFTAPGGESFIAFTPNPNMPTPERPKPPATGTIGWHELQAGGLEPAWEFYSKLFGWTIDNDMDMGPHGIYRIFTDGEAAQTGGMMTKMPEIPAPPFWTYYFHVDGIKAAVERVNAAGGKIHMGPMQVPGGQWIIQGSDPQGANFALVSNTE